VGTVDIYEDATGMVDDSNEPRGFFNDLNSNTRHNTTNNNTNPRNLQVDTSPPSLLLKIEAKSFGGKGNGVKGWERRTSHRKIR
jgi:hypothetical protein